MELSFTREDHSHPCNVYDDLLYIYQIEYGSKTFTYFREQVAKDIDLRLSERKFRIKRVSYRWFFRLGRHYFLINDREQFISRSNSKISPRINRENSVDIISTYLIFIIISDIFGIYISWIK